MVTMQSVESSFIAELGYDEERGVAVCHFKDGAKFEFPMPASKFRSWLDAPSAGKWYHANVKGKIDGRRI